MRRYASTALGIVLTGIVVVIVGASRGPDSTGHSLPVTLSAASPSAEPSPPLPPRPPSQPQRVQPQRGTPHLDRIADERDVAQTPMVLPPPSQRVGAVQQLVGQSQQENQQLGQIDAQLMAAQQQAADEAWRRQAVVDQAAAQHAVTLEALETLRRSKALLATGDSDGVDEELVRAEVALSGRTLLDVEAAREALARSDLYPARQYLEAALSERRVPR
jgi:hypothetical protein